MKNFTVIIRYTKFSIEFSETSCTICWRSLNWREFRFWCWAIRGICPTRWTRTAWSRNSTWTRFKTEKSVVTAFRAKKRTISTSLCSGSFHIPKEDPTSAAQTHPPLNEINSRLINRHFSFIHFSVALLSTIHGEYLKCVL